MGPRRLGVAILRTDREGLRAACFSAKAAISVAGGQTSRSALAADTRGTGKHGLEFGRGGLEAVHFPVTGNQRPDGVGHGRIPQGSFEKVSRKFRSICASRAGAPVPDTGFAARQPLTASLRPCLRLPAKVASGRLPLMMRSQLGDALSRNSKPNSPWARPGSLLQNKLDLCFEECGKPHQTGSARSSWPR